MSWTFKGIPSKAGEAGIILPLAIIMIMPIIAWAAQLWVNTGLVHSVKAQLQLKTKNIFEHLDTMNWITIQGSGIVPLRQAIEAEFGVTRATDGVTYSGQIKPHGLVKVTKFWIVMPTMPERTEDRDFTIEGASSWNNRYWSAKHKNTARQLNGSRTLSWLLRAESRTDLPTNRASCSSLPGFEELEGGDCLVFGSIDFDNSEIDSKQSQLLKHTFPERLWDHAENAGNTIAIFIEVEVDTVFDFLTGGANPRLSHVMAYWKPAAALAPSRTKRNPARSYFPDDYPGLIIAVAPQLTTDRADPRFRFPAVPNDSPVSDPSPAGSASAPKDFVQIIDYDPFARYQPKEVTNPTTQELHQNDGLVNMAGTPARQDNRGIKPKHSNYRYFLHQPDQISFNTRRGGEPVGPGDDENPSDYEQMLTACMNPAILVRNMFLTSLVELAARHGQFRSTTEILMVGTRHQINGYSEPSLPTILVPAGYDLLKPFAYRDPYEAIGRFQLPYLFFYNADGHNTYLTSSSSTDIPRLGHGGWLSPWQAFDAENKPVKNFCMDEVTGRNWCPYQALVAEQLRMCYHLYSDIINFRPYPRFAALKGNYFTGGHGIYGKDYLPRLKPALRQGSAASKNGGQHPWDQPCPFGYIEYEANKPYPGHPYCKREEAGGSTTTTINGDYTKRSESGLTASELVSMLGSVQPCPYELSYKIRPGEQFTCLKIINSPHPSYRLTPDFRGLTHYLGKGPNIGPLFFGNNANRLAYFPPGLFPFKVKQELPAFLAGTASPTPQTVVGATALVPNNRAYGRLTMPIIAAYSEDENYYLRDFKLFREGHKRAEPPTLVIVTHEPPRSSRNNFEADTAYSDFTNNYKRIVVVYIPTRRFYSDSDRLPNKPQYEAPGEQALVDFFKIDNVNRHLIVFDPFAEGLLTQDRKNINTQLRDYWLDLVLPGSSGQEYNSIPGNNGSTKTELSMDQSVYRRAENIFNQLITTTQRKY